MSERRLAAAAIVAIGTLVACKPHAPRVPRRDVSGMDVAQIERELALNRQDLEAAGVWVPEPTPAQPPPVTESPPPTEEPGPEPEVGATEDEAGAAEPTDAIDAAPMAQAPPEDEAEIGLASKRARRSRVTRQERRESSTRCERICDLADVTCDLQEQICALAAKHAHDVRYDVACQRAELQCDAAARECEICSD